MASKFIKKNRKVDLDIDGHVFTVDFSRDEIPSVIKGMNDKTMEIEERFKGEKNADQKILEEEKKLFKGVINELLQNETAADVIFQEDDTAIYHADVYTFLVEEYTKTISQPLSTYDPNRAERRAEK